MYLSPCELEWCTYVVAVCGTQKIVTFCFVTSRLWKDNKASLYFLWMLVHRIIASIQGHYSSNIRAARFKNLAVIAHEEDHIAYRNNAHMHLIKWIGCYEFAWRLLKLGIDLKLKSLIWNKWEWLHSDNSRRVTYASVTAFQCVFTTLDDLFAILTLEMN